MVLENETATTGNSDGKDIGLCINITLSDLGKKRIEELFNQGKTESEVHRIVFSEIEKYVQEAVAPGK